MTGCDCHRPTAGRASQRGRADRVADEFDMPTLAAAVRQQITIDDELAHYVDAAAYAREARERRHDVGDGKGAHSLNGTPATFDDVAGRRVDELVAIACADVVETGEDLLDGGVPQGIDATEVEAAVIEAREWILRHPTAAGRVGKAHI